ncbi:MAG: hypothetical protein ACHQ9S_19395 [Candidatus Binatia bacterium]
MNNNDDAASGEQCGVCGARIGQGEGREITEGGETVAYVHTNCA